ncbi:MAG TPA: hypothetical protein VIN58_00720 [Roseateles sp.]
MVKCEQCGETIMFGAKSFAGHTFCSAKCVARAREAGLGADAGIQPSISMRASAVPLLATAHALTPLLLYGAMWLVGHMENTVTLLAITLFWSWPVWLWPLIRHRHARPRSTAIALVMSLLALAAGALPMYVLTMWTLLPGLKL